MKRTIPMVIIAGFLVAAADLEAVERRPDRVRTKDGPKPRVLLTVGEADFALPSPGLAVGIPPSPAPFAVAPSMEGFVPSTAVVAVDPQGTVGAPPPSVMPPASVMIGAAGGPPLPLAPAVPLYPRVKYKDRHHIAPCAVPMCVAVRDPCDRHDHCSCGPPKCVLVEICVPPCGAPVITSKHDGSKVRYDYGKYAVNITSRHGVVVVNYDH